MCDLCKQWEEYGLTAKETLDEIGVRLQKANAKQSDHLISLSSKILDHEVPLADLNNEADQRWWDVHHPKPKEDEN